MSNKPVYRCPYKDTDKCPTERPCPRAFLRLKDNGKVICLLNVDLDRADDESLRKVFAMIELAEAEAEAEIKVGDEVELPGGKDGFCRFFVTRITRDRVAGTASDGRWAACDKREARKTGRHFPQIAEVLEAMKTDDHADTD